MHSTRSAITNSEQRTATGTPSCATGSAAINAQPKIARHVARVHPRSSRCSATMTHASTVWNCEREYVHLAPHAQVLAEDARVVSEQAARDSARGLRCAHRQV